MPDLLDIAQLVSGWAGPGEEVEALVARGRTTTVKAYGGEVESLSSAESAGIGIRVIRDHRQGFAYAGSLDDDVVRETYAEARENVAFGTVDDFLGLARPDGIARPSLDLYRPELASFPTEAKVDLAVELERSVLAGDPRVRGVRTAAFSDSVGERAVATSTGIASRSQFTFCSLSVMALATDHSGVTETGYGVSTGRTVDDLDLPKAAGDAVERATRMLGAGKPPSRRLTVVFEPDVTASFLEIVGSILNGESVLKGRSLFAGRLGDEVAVPGLTLVDDPTDGRSTGAAEADAEGLACRRNVLIEGGVLQRFLHNSYSGRRSGGASTGSAIRGYATPPGVGCRALQVEPGSLTREEVVAAAGDGLLVQSLTGVHSGVNRISGDFSVGAKGLVIRNGSLAEPVREVTIASTIQRMLKDVVAVGGDLEWTPDGCGMVSLAVGDVTLSGT